MNPEVENSIKRALGVKSEPEHQYTLPEAELLDLGSMTVAQKAAMFDKIVEVMSQRPI